MNEAVEFQSGSDAIALGGQGAEVIDQSSAGFVNTVSALTFAAGPAETVNNSSPRPVAAGQSAGPAAQPIAVELERIRHVICMLYRLQSAIVVVLRVLFPSLILSTWLHTTSVSVVRS